MNPKRQTRTLTLTREQLEASDSHPQFVGNQPLLEMFRELLTSNPDQQTFDLELSALETEGTIATRKCFRCGAPASCFVDYFPPGVFFVRRFQTCESCSDILSEMPDDERRSEFERARTTTVTKEERQP